MRIRETKAVLLQIHAQLTFVIDSVSQTGDSYQPSLITETKRTFFPPVTIILCHFHQLDMFSKNLQKFQFAESEESFLITQIFQFSNKFNFALDISAQSQLRLKVDKLNFNNLYNFFFRCRTVKLISKIFGKLFAFLLLSFSSLDFVVEISKGTKQN